MQVLRVVGVCHTAESAGVLWEAGADNLVHSNRIARPMRYGAPFRPNRHVFMCHGHAPGIMYASRSLKAAHDRTSTRSLRLGAPTRPPRWVDDPNPPRLRPGCARPAGANQIEGGDSDQTPTTAPGPGAAAPGTRKPTLSGPAYRAIFCRRRGLPRDKPCSKTSRSLMRGRGCGFQRIL
jgi:hypothetical protein